jgi:nitrite reductase/ring-hydroxylating ferredoxin subunit
MIRFQRSEQMADGLTSAQGPTPTRREVMAVLAAAGCCCVASGTASAAPEDRAPPAKPGKSDLGPVADFAEGATDKFTRDKQVIIFRKADTIHASTSICSHKRCILKKATDGKGISCPCHQSDFDLEGIPMGGPAKTPLTRYAVSIENGRLFVDTTMSFAEADWAKPGASVKVG